LHAKFENFKRGFIPQSLNVTDNSLKKLVNETIFIPGSGLFNFVEWEIVVSFEGLLNS